MGDGTVAEVLLVYADALRPRGKLVSLEEFDKDLSVVAARIKIGMLLRRRSAVCLRAIVEGWSAERIVRELY